MSNHPETNPGIKQHLPHLLFAIACMAGASGISSVYCCIADRNPAIITLIFAFFLVLVSYKTPGYLYGIICALYSAFWQCLLTDFSLSSSVGTFIGMTGLCILTVSAVTHLTAQSQLMEEYEKQLAETRLERMRVNLLRAISHDLRTPLSGITGNCLVLSENYDILEKKEKLEMINNIYECSNWLINMVDNLLSITRIQGEDLIINTNEEIVEEVVGESLQKMEKRHPGCVIHSKLPDNFIMLPMDAVLIEQVIINLLENAIIHSGSTGEIDIIVEDGQKNVTFTVKDYGSGLPEKMLDSLFDGSPSHSADAHKGMGIGLAICKTIIDAHHGSIIGRNHGNGAEFIFTLPKKE